MPVYYLYLLEKFDISVINVMKTISFGISVAFILVR